MNKYLCEYAHDGVIYGFEIEAESLPHARLHLESMKDHAENGGAAIIGKLEFEAKVQLPVQVTGWRRLLWRLLS